MDSNGKLNITSDRFVKSNSQLEIEKGLNAPVVTNHLKQSKSKLITHYVHSNKINPVDERTTLMIRNIPNKVSVDSLCKILNRWVHGKYNFLYLRLDFVNCCNTGYAFINMVNKEAVIELYKNFQGYKWTEYQNSNKIVDLVYANIQGIDSLIHKFKDSTLMEKPSEFRPKTFYVTGPLKGQPKPKFSE